MSFVMCVRSLHSCMTSLNAQLHGCLTWCDCVCSFSELPLAEVHTVANLMWAVVKLGADPLDGALLQGCVAQLLPRCCPAACKDAPWPCGISVS